jgi:hypothetical protein
MPDLLAGSTVRALDTTPAQASVAGTSIDATIITYGTAVTAGTYADCAVVFVAPTTGRVKIHASARLTNSATTSGSLIAPETRLGGTIGAGTIVEAAADANGASHYGNTFARLGVTHLLTGLTPGATYNTRLLHRSSVGTATASFALRELVVEAAS